MRARDRVHMYCNAELTTNGNGAQKILKNKLIRTEPYVQANRTMCVILCYGALYTRIRQTTAALLRHQ